MDEKLAFIETLNEEQKKSFEKLVAEGKVKTSFDPDYVLENLETFKKFLKGEATLKDFANHSKRSESPFRYYFTRKREGKEDDLCFKTNVFARDLIKAKAIIQTLGEDWSGVGIPLATKARISMDEGSLIKALQKDRIKRPRKKEQPKKDVTLPAPAEKDPAPRDNLEAEVAKRKAQADLIKRNMELAENKEPVKEEQKILKLPTADQTDFIKYEER